MLIKRMLVTGSFGPVLLVASCQTSGDHQPAVQVIDERPELGRMLSADAIELYGSQLVFFAPAAFAETVDPPLDFALLTEEVVPVPKLKPERLDAQFQGLEGSGPNDRQLVSTPPQDKKLTLSAVIEETLLRDPGIAMEQSRFRQAYHEVDVAEGALGPRIDLQGSAGPRFADSRDDEKTETLSRDASLTLRQNVYDGDSKRHTKTRREHEKNAVNFNQMSVIEDVTLDVSMAYLGLLQADELYVLALENQAEHEKFLEIVRASLEQGFSSQVDLSRVEARLAEARSLVFDQLSARDQASQQLEKLIGRKPKGLLPPPQLPNSLPDTLDAAVDEMTLKNPGLQRLRSEQKAAKKELDAHFGKFVPAVDFLLQGSWNHDSAGNTGVGGDLKGVFSLNYNLYASGADKARERVLRERMREAGWAYDQEFRELKQRVADQFTALSASRMKRDNLDDGVAASTSVSQLYLEQFKSGRRSVFELLGGQVDLYGAKRERTENLFEELKRGYQILKDLGRLRATMLP